MMQKFHRALATPAAWILAWPVAQYIRWHREQLLPHAKPLPETTKRSLAAYFPALLLDQVRIVEQDPIPITDPPFVRLVRRLGFDFPDLSSVAAITLDHLIAARDPMDNAVLFHELVHVAQFQVLGVHRFSRLYVQGFLLKGSYTEIPLERCAYELESRFCLDPSSFDTFSEVKLWREARGF